MYSVISSARFEKSFQKLKRSGKFKPAAQEKFKRAVTVLAATESLPASFSDHRLHGEYGEYRECHIKGDMVLVYQIIEASEVIVLVDIGSHSDVFE